MCSMHLSTPAPKNETRHGTAALGGHWGREWAWWQIAWAAVLKFPLAFSPTLSTRPVRVAPMMERYLNASLLGCVRAKMLLRIRFPKNAPWNNSACAKWRFSAPQQRKVRRVRNNQLQWFVLKNGWQTTDFEGSLSLSLSEGSSLSF